MQQKVKKHVHVPVLIAIWVVIPVFEISMAAISTDIIKGVCVPYGVHSSVVMEKAVSCAIFFVGYLLPLALMIFCYSRIVYTLRQKVTRQSERADFALGAQLAETSFTVCFLLVFLWVTPATKSTKVGSSAVL